MAIITDTVSMARVLRDLADSIESGLIEVSRVSAEPGNPLAMSRRKTTYEQIITIVTRPSGWKQS